MHVNHATHKTNHTTTTSPPNSPGVGALRRTGVRRGPETDTKTNLFLRPGFHRSFCLFCLSSVRATSWTLCIPPGAASVLSAGNPNSSVSSKNNYPTLCLDVVRITSPTDGRAGCVWQGVKGWEEGGGGQGGRGVVSRGPPEAV